MNDLIVSVVPQIDLIEMVQLHDLVPVLLGQVGRAVHGPTVADDQAVPGLGPRQAEVRVLQL